jgi:D-alanyl-D-alanine carboxypeptidase
MNLATLILALLPLHQEPSPAPVERGALARQVEELRAQFALPALIGARIDKSGAIVEFGAAGHTEAGGSVPVGLESPWHLGSCSKALTATLAARLVLDGQLAWDSSPATVLAELAPQIDPSWAAVRLDQLLAHRAGAPLESEAGAAWLGLVAHPGPPRAARAALAARLLAQPTRTVPGEAYAYSNFGYSLVGAMLETVSDRSFEELVRERLGPPLGLTRVGFGAPAGAHDPRGHRLVSGALQAVPPGRLADNPPGLAPAGTLHLPLADWARFVALHLRRGAGENEWLPPASFDVLHRPLGDNYALGWIVTERPWSRGPVLTHSGSNTMWHCVVWAAPAEGFAVLACTNASTPQAPLALDAVCALLLERQQAAAR